MAQWVSEISLSGPVSLFESLSLVNDNNFQTNYFKTEHCQMSDTIILVESINQFKIQVHICSLMLLVWSPYWSNPVVALCYNAPLFIGITWELQQVIGSFSIDNSNGSENITSKMNSPFFQTLSCLFPLAENVKCWWISLELSFWGPHSSVEWERKNYSSSLVYVLHKMWN